ncbi:MAG TPA: cyclodeaminase/cyclohydrolase family protein [Candidatus Ventrousia excrementavium]|uniref:Cyclodeaminase/cyclohydrolase family protein n=1 Tax=Candidatus Ventrousia excrementavium TaxID=2840961 RepID=A0A9D1LKS3_9CLOT|nr:cyclodeaminase/cyclohydrolase family protein [Candidatus Ventrousia excrementavium]
MELTAMTVSQYLDVLASDAPAPGGGSASALCGAQGAGLVAMVAGLTVGRAKYADFEQDCRKAAEEAGRLQKELVASIDRDTEAFNRVSAAMKLPRETDEQKAARRDAIAEATLAATQVPFATMGLAAQALEVCRSIVGRSNPNAASDLGVAALNLLACVRGAWLNVLINLSGVRDENERERFRAEGERIESSAARLADEIYQSVKNSL